MARVNRKARVRPGNQISRNQVIELLLGPNGNSAFKSDAERLSAWRDIEAKLSPAFAAKWVASGCDLKNFSAIAEDYARRVLDSQIPACDSVRMACRRHLDDLANWPTRYDARKADRVCRFAELLPHVKGTWAASAELIVLQPWQIFILCCLFGWMKKSSDTRRFSLAYIEVGRKNAKSILAAIIGLYMFACDGEFGAEVYSGATKEDQAMEVFRPALLMMHRSRELCQFLGIKITSPTSTQMSIPEDGSRFEVVVRRPGDGASPSAGIVDEYHEHDSDTLYDTFRTGMGARMQPLLLAITTAGFKLAGPCKLLQADVMKVLAGSLARDEVFGIIYTIDPNDDWTSKSALIKANPNFNVSVFADYLESEQAAAIQTARKQGVFKTKHLCVWVGANAAFFNLQKWKELGDRALKPEQFIGLPCVIGLDLSTKRDFTARVIAFKKIVNGKDHFYFFPTLYLPEEQASRPEAQHYHGWRESMQVHSGATVDLEAVNRDTQHAAAVFKARELAYDPFNATHLSQCFARLTKTTPVEIPQNVGHLSPAMKELDSLIAEGRAHHDGNPIMNWMMGNVTAHEDANENVFPRKDDRENKIDGAGAAIMALSRLMVAAPKRSIYATRGLLTISPQELMGAGA